MLKPGSLGFNAVVTMEGWLYITLGSLGFDVVITIVETSSRYELPPAAYVEAFPSYAELQWVELCSAVCVEARFPWDSIQWVCTC